MNLTKWIVACFVTWSAISACTEEFSPSTDIGDENIAGQLRIRVSYADDPLGTPLAGARINLHDAADPDTLNYLFSSNTDAEGFFKFTWLTSSKEYVLRYRDSIDGALYTATSEPALVGSNPLTLTATVARSGQTGVQLLVLGPSGSPASGVRSCFYRDSLIANAADSTTCAGAAFTLTSGTAGTAAKYGMAAGEYILLSYLDVGKQRLRSRNKLSVTSNQVVNATIHLAPPPPNPRIITLITRDANSEPLPGAQVCLYTSRLLRSASDNCAGAAYSYTIAATGSHTTPAPPDSRYYGLASYVLNDSTRWLDTQMIEIPTDLNDTIVFRLQPE